MNKSQLAELYSKRDYPVDEFIALPEFKALEAEADAIEAIEGFRLPEITKLICCSGLLAQLPWAEKYASVRPLFCNASQIDAAALLKEYSDPKAFGASILEYADPRLLSMLMRAFDQRKDERKRLLGNKREIEKSISQMEKAESSSGDNGEEKEKLEQKLKDAEACIASIDSFIKKWKKHYDLTKKAADKNTQDAIDIRRAKAYEVLFPSIPAEEVFLKQFIRDGVLSDEMQVQLQSEVFCASVLRYMEHGSYQGLEMPVVMRLYEQGAIDLEAPFVMEYIRSHASLVSDYLSGRLSGILNNDNEESDDRALLEVALRIESTYCMEASSACFCALWNTIREPELWMTALRFASDLDLPDIHDAVYGLMKGLEDDASEALVEALFSPQAQEMHISATEVIGTALRNRADISPVLVISAFQKMEQISRSAQRKLRTADRKINGQGQALFSSVYEPVERLELIASDLRMSKGDIPCQLVANELVDIVTGLRAGMRQLNLYPVCDVDAWQKGHPVAFNAQQHRKPMNTEDDPEEVILQTMGFRYLGDDGDWQQYNAQVVPKPSLKNASKSDRLEKKESGPRNQQASNHDRQSKPLKGMAVPFYAEITRKKGVSKGKVKHIASISTAAKKKHVKDDKGGPKR